MRPGPVSSDSGFMRWTLSDMTGPRVRTDAWVALASILVYVAGRHRRHIYLVLHSIWPKQPVWISRIASGYEIEMRRTAEGSAARRNAAQHATDLMSAFRGSVDLRRWSNSSMHFSGCTKKVGTAVPGASDPQNFSSV